MIWVATVWLISLIFIAWVTDQIKEEIEKIMIDHAWESVMPVKTFKILFGVLIVLLAPIVAIRLAVAYIKD